MSDVVSDWQAIEDGLTTQATKYHIKYCKVWQLCASTCNINAFPQDCEKINIILFVTAFAAQIRQGYYGKGLKIKVPDVAKTLSAISMSIHLVGKSCPLKTTEDDYIIPSKRLI